MREVQHELPDGVAIVRRVFSSRSRR
jgi:hypothetical protein